MLLIDLWKPIIINGKKTAYEISTSGEIYSVKRKKLQKPFMNNSGYLRVELSIGDSKPKKFYVHRLVAMTFVPIPDKYIKLGLSYDDLTINHDDCIKTHNYADNLSWCTRGENVKLAYEDGLCDNHYGENNISAKMSNETALECCKMLANGKTKQEISKKLKISEGVVASIKNRQSWTHISKDFEFVNLHTIISDDTIHDICRLLESGEKVSKVAKLTNTTEGYVYNIKYRKNRKDISKNYKF